MLVDFKDMPSTSRVWIYQSNQPIGGEIKDALTSKLNHFLATWESHGIPLKASWELLHELFLVIAVDESQHAASGCSIDKSVHLVRELERDLQIELLGKSSIAILEENSISTVGIKDLKKTIQEGKIRPHTVIFNNLVPTIGEMRQNWKLPAEKTWLSRYFNS